MRDHEEINGKIKIVTGEREEYSRGEDSHPKKSEGETARNQEIQ